MAHVALFQRFKQLKAQNNSTSRYLKQFQQARPIHHYQILSGRHFSLLVLLLLRKFTINNWIINILPIFYYLLFNNETRLKFFSSQVMEMINQYSRQRGRVIEYQDLLYGYFRLDPLHGPDYILDMLLKYKKYRGRKMTVPVRRHAYLQQQFTGK